MINRIKRLFCRHKDEEQVQLTKFYDGKTMLKYGKQCKKCGRTKWL